MTIIEGASVSVKTMADGTLRLTVDVEPVNAQAAFALFGAPGRAIALSALKDGSAAVKEPEPEKPKGGEWAKMVGMWCADPDFWRFMNQRHPGDRPITNSEQAASRLRVYCGIDSRAVLDSDLEALVFFKHAIRRPFMEWMQKNGIQK